MKLLYDASIYLQGVLDCEIVKRKLSPEEIPFIEQALRNALNKAITDARINGLSIRGVIVTNIRETENPKPLELIDVKRG